MGFMASLGYVIADNGLPYLVLSGEGGGADGQEAADVGSDRGTTWPKGGG